MTAQIIPLFPTPVLEGEIVSEVPPTALPGNCDLAKPLANRFAHIVPPEACGEVPKRRKPRAKMRVEQTEVTCTKVPRKQHRDLRTLRGVLTLDWKGETPWTATFDPADENVPNIVAPIEKLVARGGAYEVTTDEGVWGFAAVAESDDDDESDEE